MRQYWQGYKNKRCLNSGRRWRKLEIKEPSHLQSIVSLLDENETYIYKDIHRTWSFKLNDVALCIVNISFENPRLLNKTILPPPRLKSKSLPKPPDMRYHLGFTIVSLTLSTHQTRSELIQTQSKLICIQRGRLDLNIQKEFFIKCTPPFPPLSLLSFQFLLRCFQARNIKFPRHYQAFHT